MLTSKAEYKNFVKTLKKKSIRWTDFLKRAFAEVNKKLNVHLLDIKYLESKRFGGPKNALLTFDEIDNYVAKKSKTNGIYQSWKFFKGELLIQEPVLTIGKADRGAEVKSYPADTTEHVYLMPNVRIFSQDFYTLTEDKLLLAPVSNVYGDDRICHPAFSKLLLPKQKKLKGRSIIIRGGAYWHKMQDGLPMLFLAQLAGFKISDFDHFIIQDNYIDKNSIFTRAGIPIEKQVRLSNINDAYYCEELFFSSWYNRKGNWYKQFLLDQIKPSLSNENLPSRIYLSRSRVNTRKVLNEAEVISFLEIYGFACIHNEDLNTDQQISLFQNATHIVSCHGSQLTNIIFCKPGTKVCEIRHVGHNIHYRKAFHDISNGFGLDYFLLYTDKGEDFLDNFGNVILTDTHIYINLNDLKTMLMAMGITEAVEA